MTQYSGVYTLQQQGQALTSGQWATEPYFKQTTLLLHADGVAGGAQNNTFLDSSTNAFAITRNGDTTQGSTSPYFGAGFYSCWLGNSSTWNYVTYPSAVITFNSTATFTIEGWIYISAYQGTSGYLTPFLGEYDQSSTNAWTAGLDYQGYPLISWWDGSGKQAKGANVVPLNTWTFVQFVANAGAVSIRVNGVTQTLSGTTTLTTPSQTSTLSTGTERQHNTLYTIADLRVSNVVRAAALPTAPMSSDANTKLLTLRSNRFYDESSNNYTVTVPSGTTPTIQMFSAYAPQYAYTAAGTGGSGYFDGSGDYLQTVANTAFAPGTGDFTVEGWYYSTAASGNQQMWAQTTSGSDYFVVMFEQGNSRFRFIGNGANAYSTAIAVPNAWNHFAVVRNSSSVTVYCNGVAGTPVSFTDNFSNTSYLPTISGYTHSATNLLTGYLSNLRYVKGTAVYTGAFAPPSLAPLATSGAASTACYPSTTNINTSFAASATSLLCSYTNAGIIDSTAKNDVWTYGTAAVSTSVVKYGSGSLYFSGSTSNYMLVPASKQFNQLYSATNSFTVEFWAYPTSFAAIGTILNTGISNGATGWRIDVSTAGVISWASNGSAVSALNATLALNTWYHIAYVYSNGVISLFLNGVRIGSAATSWTNTTDNLAIGSSKISGFDYPYSGYVDDLRITTGVARYTSNFVPPKVAFANQ